MSKKDDNFYFDIHIKTNAPRVLEMLIYHHPKETLKQIGMDIKTYFKFPYLVRKAFLCKWGTMNHTPAQGLEFVVSLLSKEKSCTLLERAVDWDWIPKELIKKGLAKIGLSEFQKLFDRVSYYRLIGVHLLKLCPVDYLPGMFAVTQNKYFADAIEARLKNDKEARS